METKQTLTFNYGKNCKRPRSVNSSCNLFCLYAPDEITISWNELKNCGFTNESDLSTKYECANLAFAVV